MKRLHRSNTDRMIAGICGGIGETYDVDPTVVRLIVLLAMLVTAFFPMLFIYLIGVIIIPVRP